MSKMKKLNPDWLLVETKNGEVLVQTKNIELIEEYYENKTAIKLTNNTVIVDLPFKIFKDAYNGE